MWRQAGHFLTLPVDLGCHFSEGALGDRVRTVGDMRQIQDAFLNLWSEQQQVGDLGHPGPCDADQSRGLSPVL